MDDKPTNLDVTVFSFLINIFVCPIESPVKDYVLSKQNLVDYCQRVSSEFYPELE